jgi:hypothetical protein
VRSVGLAAHMGAMRNAYRILSGKMKKYITWETCIDEVLKWILKD